MNIFLVFTRESQTHHVSINAWTFRYVWSYECIKRARCLSKRTGIGQALAYQLSTAPCSGEVGSACSLSKTQLRVHLVA
jgi:hypothetical protein